MPPARDITREFAAAASALATGELIKDEFFTLAESVGALEIMDPKMDSGHLEPGESLDAEYDFSRSLSAKQIIGLVDELMSFETAWQQGHSLAQTVFTCLYIDRLLWPVPRKLSEATFRHPRGAEHPGELVDVILRAFCCAVVKTCDWIQAQVTSEQYYEEEDFSGHVYRRELLTRVPTKEVLELLEDAQTTLQAMPGLEQTLRTAISQRLRLREQLLHALAAQVPQHGDEACKSWSECLLLLEEVKASSAFGEAVPEAFSLKVQRKLASSTPPRPMIRVNAGEAIEHLRRMCTNARDAFLVLDCVTGTSIITFLNTFMSRNPQPNIYVRCLMQSLIYKEGLFLGRMSHQDFIFRDLSEFVLGDSILTTKAENGQNKSTIQGIMHTFSEATAHSFADLTRCLCMNRSRVRRMLTHTLNDWENLQFEAEDVDIQLREHTEEKPLIDRLSAGEEIWAYSLSSWVYAYKLKQMEWIIQLGFELNVYMLDEFAGMYWYLKYLASTRLQHLDRILTFAKRYLDFISKPSAKQLDTFEHTFANITFAMEEAKATTNFADALSNLYQALLLAKVVPETLRPYGTDDFRHNLRLKPFLTIALPAVPSRDEMIDAIQGGVRALSIRDRGRYTLSNELLDTADDLCKTARKQWDAVSKHAPDVAQCLGCEDAWRRKTKDVLKSVISAGIAIAGTRKAIAKAGHDPISDVKAIIIDTGYHEWWSVPVLKST